jgi:hypothetical protein
MLVLVLTLGALVVDCCAALQLMLLYRQGQPSAVTLTVLPLEATARLGVQRVLLTTLPQKSHACSQACRLTTPSSRQAASC